jgi:hypothetical protein
MKILSTNNAYKPFFKGSFTKKIPLNKKVQTNILLNQNNVKKEDVIKFLKTKISTLKQKKEKYEALYSVLKTSTNNNKENLSTIRDSAFLEEVNDLYEVLFYKEREELSAIKDEIPIIEKTITKIEKLLENLEKK